LYLKIAEKANKFHSFESILNDEPWLYIPIIPNDFARICKSVIIIKLSEALFFLLHPNGYYKLLFCITFSNTFGNLWKS